ncbi:MAG: FAD-dependent oxidoreductase [Alphaproteobacteria bacterium]
MFIRKKIAIIGSGISGLSSAYYLKDKYETTLFEKDSRLGGHSRTIKINNDIDVDTGFIVLNDRTYPCLKKLFDDLNVELSKTEMSFSISANQGQLEWSGTSLDSLFAQRKNVVNFSMLKGIYDIVKFNNNAVSMVKKSPLITLRELINEMKLGNWFKNYYILPMGGAIWSCSLKVMLDFPAATFVKFFENHGLLNINNRPQWYTLKYKSISYVKILEAEISKKGKIIKNADIKSVTREKDMVKISSGNEIVDYFDQVIFAIHPEEILKILKDPTLDERNILTKFSRQKNIAYTHSDTKQMPRLVKCWSSWNYLYEENIEENSVSVTYWMNKLQHIEQNFPLFVTLNPIEKIAENKLFDVHEFYHPIYNNDAIIGSQELEKIQGSNYAWFCGAYLRYGFHEDGIASAVNLLNKMDQKK